ncbi:ROK family protein [Arcanobacterium haemolyticum]|nr:ROK family protein [Arcanobacterium haemolyticum]
MNAVSHSQSDSPKPGLRTLAVDCGGGGIKTSLLDAGGFQIGSPRRTALRYPLSPEDLLNIVASHADDLGDFDRITLGMPGMIRHGIVVYTPHYIRKSGPHTKIAPELEEAWDHLDIQSELRTRFGVPALVLNDAEVAAAGVVSGNGVELVITLGTGLGNALLDQGRLTPHLEMSHAPLRWGLTYDDYIGEAERIRLGDSAWSRRVAKAIDTLWPVFRWDRLYVGGGNAARIKPFVREKLGSNVIFIPNAAGMNGGVRAWSMVGADTLEVRETEPQWDFPD